jgi:hypothetical protein
MILIIYSFRSLDNFDHSDNLDQVEHLDNLDPWIIHSSNHLDSS